MKFRLNLITRILNFTSVNYNQLLYIVCKLYFPKNPFTLKVLRGLIKLKIHNLIHNYVVTSAIKTKLDYRGSKILFNQFKKIAENSNYTVINTFRILNFRLVKEQ